MDIPKGARVRLSDRGKSSGIFDYIRLNRKLYPGKDRLGTADAASSHDRVYVIWDGQTTRSGYHVNFIEMVPPEECGVAR